MEDVITRNSRMDRRIGTPNLLEGLTTRSLPYMINDQGQTVKSQGHKVT